jgi:hypothetical protein
MADLTYDILTNREKFPDDRKIVLGDGEEITVKEFRDAVLPKADFTRASQTWAEKERQLTQAQEGLQSQLATALAAREAAGRAPQPTGQTGEYTEEDLLRDPILGPIMKGLKATQESLKAHEERIKLHEDTWLKNQYTSQLNSIESRWNAKYNSDGKKPFDKKAFLDRVLETGTTNLDLAYDAYSAPHEIERVTREAEARGIEKGKQQAKVPVVPFGNRRGPVKPKDLPESLDQVSDDMVLEDEEMQQALRGEYERRLTVNRQRDGAVAQVLGLDSRVVVNALQSLEFEEQAVALGQFIGRQAEFERAATLSVDLQFLERHGDVCFGCLDPKKRPHGSHHIGSLSAADVPEPHACITLASQEHKEVDHGGRLVAQSTTCNTYTNF